MYFPLATSQTSPRPLLTLFFGIPSILDILRFAYGFSRRNHPSVPPYLRLEAANCAAVLKDVLFVVRYIFAFWTTTCSILQHLVIHVYTSIQRVSFDHNLRGERVVLASADSVR